MAIDFGRAIQGIATGYLQAKIILQKLMMH